MNPDNGSTPPAATPPADQPTPPATPPAPTEGQPAVPASSTETPTPPAPAAPPAEGQPAAPAEGEPAAPAEPATPPAAPRESAMQKRAREARDKAEGLTKLADRLDPTPAKPVIAAPQPTPPTPGAPAQTENLPDYVDEDGNVVPDKLDAYIDRRADQRYNARRGGEQLQEKAKAFVGSLDTDAKALAGEYAELDPNKPEYDADLDDAITEAFTSATSDADGNIVRVDLSLRQFAEPLVKAARKRATAAAAAVPNTTAGAGMDSAVVPGTGPAPSGKRFEDMTVKEQEADLIRRHGKPVQR